MKKQDLLNQLIGSMKDNCCIVASYTAGNPFDVIQRNPC